MKWHQITEAPLADFSSHGDPATPGSFRQEDLRALHNEKWLSKVYKMFEKTPYNFNIYVYNAPEGIANLGKQRYPNSPKDFPVKVNDLDNLADFGGIRDIKTIEDIIGKKIPNTKNSITVLLVENEGTNRIPLSPWIVAHRVVHSIMENDVSPVSNIIMKDFTQFINSFMRYVRLYVMNSPTYDGYSKATFNKATSLIGKFRSARMELLGDNPGEFMVDSLVQYLVQGSITYNRPQIGDKVAPDDPLFGLARQHYNEGGSHAKANFVMAALKQEFPKKPSRVAVSWTAYDGKTPMATFGDTGSQSGIEYRIKKYEDRGWKVVKKEPSAKQLANYKKYTRRMQKLADMYDEWRFDGVFHLTPTEETNKLIDNFEHTSNNNAKTLFDSVVGKAIIL